VNRALALLFAVGSLVVAVSLAVGQAREVPPWTPPTTPPPTPEPRVIKWLVRVTPRPMPTFATKEPDTPTPVPYVSPTPLPVFAAEPVNRADIGNRQPTPIPGCSALGVCG
jgi:hypothetical protein